MLVLLAIFGPHSHDFLAFHDTRRFRHAAQASKGCSESFRRAEKYGAIICLVSDCLRLGSECLFCLLAMTHCR